MSFIMKRISQDCDTPALRYFREGIMALDNRDFLLSPDFGEICQEISQKFRNGGVHDKIVSYDIFKEAFEKILERPLGYLSCLLSTKTP